MEDMDRVLAEAKLSFKRNAQSLKKAVVCPRTRLMLCDVCTWYGSSISNSTAPPFLH